MTLTAKQLHTLHVMGIDVYVRQNLPVNRLVDTATARITQGDVGMPDTPAADLSALQLQVQTCTGCELHQTRTQTVFGVGNTQTQIMFVGEAPGADEDAQGEPFVGRAGQLLNEMLRAINIRRQEVYIANILKCRPPNNRDPKPEEAAQCMPFLLQQIALIRPKILVALGRVAAQRLLQTDMPLNRMRQQTHTHPQSGIPMLVTYHPAYLLRTPADKRKAWEDLLYLKRIVSGI